MEGRLQKYCGFFSRWKEYKYILHEGVLYEYNLITNVELGAIHMGISSVAVDPKHPLQIIIHNGISQVFLKAATIKEKAEWVNALKESKSEADTHENRKSEKHIHESPEKMNEVLATNIFNKFDPLYQKIGKVWSTQAQFEEIMSVIEPEIRSSPKLKGNGEKLLELTTQLKESVAEVLYDLEMARKEFAKALHQFSENDEPLEFNEDSGSEEDLKSMATLRSVKIQPKSHHSSNKSIEEVKGFSDDEDEERIETIKKMTTEMHSFDPRDLSEDAIVRSQLPAFKDHTRKFSIWGLIRDNIGQDLTRVTLPIILNEPVTMLQKCCEAMANYQLLEKAAEEDDPCMRMAYVMAFNTVQYHSIPDRTLKPFNPLLGETYEYVCKSFKYLSEQVSHHPPITASHAYGKGYEYWTHTEMKSKFWGKSLEFTPLGKAYFIIGDQHYMITRPSTIANNIIIGTLYLDLGGTTKCVCPQTGIKGELIHKERGMFTRGAFIIDGHINDSEGNKVLRVHGHWNSEVYVTNLKTKKDILIWEAPPKLENYVDQYGFTEFAINLNNLPKELEKKIAPTDSRFRPDLRAFENGDIDAGGQEKHRLEEKQREARKIRKDKGENWEPLYFEEVIDEDTGDKFFKINDKYWLNRARGDWSECPDLF